LEDEDLHRHTQPTGAPEPVLVAPFEVNDKVPSEEEMGDAVDRMKVRKAPGPSGLRAEHLKEWQAAAIRGANPDSKRWETFVQLVQHVFESGEVPQELSWSVLVLIPKGSGGCRGIGLLEVVWQVISSIIDSRLKKLIQFYDSLHGFRPGRGTGTATIEVKLRMQLSRIREIHFIRYVLIRRKHTTPWIEAEHWKS
jgi:hypothetical protein